MKRYRVEMARIEHQVYRFEVIASNEEHAQELVEQRWSDGDYDPDKYEVVHAEEFINGIEEAKEQHA